MKYFKKLGWDDAWIMTAEGIIKDEFKCSYLDYALTKQATNFVKVCIQFLFWLRLIFIYTWHVTCPSFPCLKRVILDMKMAWWELPVQLLQLRWRWLQKWAQSLLGILPCQGCPRPFPMVVWKLGPLSPSLANGQGLPHSPWCIINILSFALKLGLIIYFLTVSSVAVEHISTKGCLLLSHVQNQLSAQSTHALLCLGYWGKLGYIKNLNLLGVASLPDAKDGEMGLDDEH